MGPAASRLAEANGDLEHERHRWRELFMAAPHAYVVSDLAGTIQAANRAAGELFGLTPAQLVGKAIAGFVGLGDRERFDRWARSLRESAQDGSLCADCSGRYSFEMRTFSRDRTFPAQVIAAPVVERDGSIESIRWMIGDQTDRHRVTAVGRLREEARKKDEFLAVLGHELRNPLAAITLASDILAGARGADPRRTEWAADVVRRHAEQLERLVDDLLDVSRVTHGKVMLQVAPVDLRDVVAAAAETVEPLMACKRHALAIARPDEPFVAACGPPASRCGWWPSPATATRARAARRSRGLRPLPAEAGDAGRGRAHAAGPHRVGGRPGMIEIRSVDGPHPRISGMHPDRPRLASTSWGGIGRGCSSWRTTRSTSRRWGRG